MLRLRGYPAIWANKWGPKRYGRGFRATALTDQCGRFDDYRLNKTKTH